MSDEQPCTSRQVMIPIVISDADEATFDYYWNVVAMPGDKVLLVHVFTAKEATKEKWQENQTQLKTVVKPFEEKCVERKMNYQMILHAGKPGEGIVELIATHKPDLLMIGSRGLSKLRRTIETSVSEYVHHHAKTPCLIVPHNWNEQMSVATVE